MAADDIETERPAPYRATALDWERASNELNKYVDQLGAGESINWDAAKKTFEGFAASGQGNIGDWINWTFAQRKSWLGNGASGSTSPDSGQAATGPLYQGGGVDEKKFNDPTHTTDKYVLLRALSALNLTPAQVRAQLAAGSGPAVDAMKKIGYEVVSNNQVYKPGIGRLDVIHSDNSEFGYRRVSQDREGKVLWPGAKTPAKPAAPAAPKKPVTPNYDGDVVNFPAGGNNTLGSLLTPFNQPYQPADLDKAVQEALARMPQLEPLQLPQFVAPTADSMLADPSFEFRRKQGERALMNNKVAQGLGRTAGTLQSLVDYNQDAASQEYNNIFNRGLQTWGADVSRQQAMYEPKVLEYTTKTGVGLDAARMADSRGWEKWLQDWRIYDQNQRNIFDRLRWKSEFDRDTAAA